MNKLKNKFGLAKIISIVLTIAVFVSSFSFLAWKIETIADSYSQPNEPVFGSFLTVGGQNYYLNGGGVGTSDTSITLTDFDTPVSGYDLSMSNFGEIGYVTLEPSSSTRQEFVSFTGITQNSDDTATLTGVTRGLSPVSPYTASTTMQKAHPGGSIVVISNPPQLYSQVTFKENDENINGLWTFNTVLPTSNKTATTSSQFATKAYVDNVANAGAATSTELRGGLVELSTARENASSTDGGADKPLVIQAKHATDTPQRGCATGYTSTAGAGCTVVARLTGKIRQAWLNLTEDFTFTGAINIIASVAKKLTLNGVQYAFPTTDGTASSTALLNDGTGNLSWNETHWQLVAATTTTANMKWATTTISTTKDFLRLEVYFAGMSSDTQFAMLRFNGDSAANYGYKKHFDFAAVAAPEDESDVKFISLFSPNSTTTPQYLTADITNKSTLRKLIRYTNFASNSDANAPARTDGIGVWNNTSSNITSIVLGIDNAETITSGTIIRVYAK